jgi:hypothetical protein
VLRGRVATNHRRDAIYADKTSRFEPTSELHGIRRHINPREPGGGLQHMRNQRNRQRLTVSDDGTDECSAAGLPHQRETHYLPVPVRKHPAAGVNNRPDHLPSAGAESGGIQIAKRCNLGR